MTTPRRPHDGRSTAAAVRRRAREAEIVIATRELFEARGTAEVQIEEIARAVGINRAIVYRHFTGKEEIVALTLVAYLDELRQRLAEATGGDASVRVRLQAAVEAFIAYGVAHPAFVDGAHALMRRSGPELLDEISESALFRLGRGISGCLSLLVRLLEEGNRTGDFRVSDPTLLANTLYASGLGTLQLARVGILVTESAPGVPQVGTVSHQQVSDYMVAATLAMATA